jgi:hypothetical protein
MHVDIRRGEHYYDFCAQPFTLPGPTALKQSSKIYPFSIFASQEFTSLVPSQSA